LKHKRDEFLKKLANLQDHDYNKENYPKGNKQLVSTGNADFTPTVLARFDSECNSESF
jgi:hypothetical protein